NRSPAALHGHLSDLLDRSAGVVPASRFEATKANFCNRIQNPMVLTPTCPEHVVPITKNGPGPSRSIRRERERPDARRAARQGQSGRSCQAVVPKAGSVGWIEPQYTPAVPQPAGSPLTPTACEMQR